MAEADDLYGRFTTIFQHAGLEDTFQIADRIVPDSTPGHVSVDSLPCLVGGQGAGELELGPTLSEGGMGAIVSGRQIALHRDVVVKIVRRDKSTPRAIAELLREGWVLGLLEHPNIVPAYALGKDEGGAPLLVMKKISGVTWRQLISERGRHPEILPGYEGLELHLHIAQEVCHALHFAHSRRLVHRDIKPDNVMIGPFGEVYLVDWGLAVSLDDSTDRFRRASEVDAVAGTPAYMAPEMVEPKWKPISPQTDVYLLGSVLHEILTGVPPHQSKSVFDTLFNAFKSEAKEYPATVSQELSGIVKTAMSREPSQRFSSAEAMRMAIEEFLRHRSADALTQEGNSRKAHLTSLIAAAPEDQEAIGEVHRTFAEVRFAFESALRAWPQSPSAKAALGSTIEAMARFELSRGALASAELLIGELEQPPSDLVLEVESARLREKEEAIRVQELEALAEHGDVRIGSRTRMWLAIALLLVWTTIPFVVGTMARSGEIRVTMDKFFTQGAGFGAMMLLGIALGRRTLLKTQINRRLMATLLLLSFALILHRASGWLLNLGVAELLALESTTKFLTVGLMAVAFDTRLAIAALPYVASGLLASAFPAWIFEIDALGNLGALGLVALVWRQSDLLRDRTGRASLTPPGPAA